MTRAMTVRSYSLRRAAPLLLLVSALGDIGSALAQAPGAAPPSVTVARPVVKEINEWDDFIGRFEAVDQVDIRARVSGYLDKVHFQDGSTVRAGDLLFTIDQRPYRAALQEAEATFQSARARLEFATTDLERRSAAPRREHSRAALRSAPPGVADCSRRG